MKICIVGGVAGGASAACRLRRLSEEAEVVLFEKGEYVSYANCGLPYYIGGEVTEKADLLVAKPELLRNRFRIDVRTGSEVTEIHRDRKTVTVKEASGKTYEESYDKLLLSPGGEPKKLRIPGADLPGVFTLRTVPDTLEIDRFLTESKAASAVVAGGGFIGLEMAENLRKRGLTVTVAEFAGQIMAPLDPEMTAPLEAELKSHGVTLLLHAGVASVAQEAGGLRVTLTDGTELSTGMLLMSVGVVPESALAAAAGLALGVGNSIAVDGQFRTNDPDIYAVGDAVAVRNMLTGAETLLPLAGPANREGRAAAANLLGGSETIGKGVQGSSVVRVFSLTAASTGLNEKQANAGGIPYGKTYIHPQSHASYYPGAKPLAMKLLFGQDGKVLGAQAVGAEGVEKRIDVIATAIRLGATVYDLEELELCYAPPYSSAKDPVNMLGFTAANILKGDMPVFYAEQLADIDPEKAAFLDVRTPAEVANGKIPGFSNIPLDSLRERLSELDRSKPVYVTCQVGLRGYLAVRILLQNGFTAYNLSGGYKTYQMVQGATELKAEPYLCYRPE